MQKKLIMPIILALLVPLIASWFAYPVHIYRLVLVYFLRNMLQTHQVLIYFFYRIESFTTVCSALDAEKIPHCVLQYCFQIMDYRKSLFSVIKTQYRS